MRLRTGGRVCLPARVRPNFPRAGDAQEMRRRCAGDTQEMRRRCAGDAQEIRRRYAGDTQEIRRRCAGDAQVMRRYALCDAETLASPLASPPKLDGHTLPANICAYTSPRAGDPQPDGGAAEMFCPFLRFLCDFCLGRIARPPQPPRRQAIRRPTAGLRRCFVHSVSCILFVHALCASYLHTRCPAQTSPRQENSLREFEFKLSTRV